MPGYEHPGILSLTAFFICVSLGIVLRDLFVDHFKKLIVTFDADPVLGQIELYCIINFLFVIFHGAIVV